MNMMNGKFGSTFNFVCDMFYIYIFDNRVDEAFAN